MDIEHRLSKIVVIWSNPGLLYTYINTHIHTWEDIQPTQSYIVDVSASIIHAWNIFIYFLHLCPTCQTNITQLPALKSQMPSIFPKDLTNQCCGIAILRSHDLRSYFQDGDLSNAGRKKEHPPKVQLFFWWTPWTKSRDWSSIFEGWAGLLGRSSFDLQVSWTLKRLDLWSHAQNNHGSGFLKLQLTHFGNRRGKPTVNSPVGGWYCHPFERQYWGSGMAYSWVHCFGSKWAIWETQGSRTGQPQIWEGPAYNKSAEKWNIWGLSLEGKWCMCTGMT